MKKLVLKGMRPTKDSYQLSVVHDGEEVTINGVNPNTMLALLREVKGKDWIKDGLELSTDFSLHPRDEDSDELSLWYMPSTSKGQYEDVLRTLEHRQMTETMRKSTPRQRATPKRVPRGNLEW